MDTQSLGPQPLPAGLADISPGGELARLVGDVPVEGVSGFDTIEVATAAYRQATHSRAVFLRAVAESGMRAAGSVDTVERVESPSEFSSDEIRAALTWSRTRSENTFWFAHSLFERLPILGEAMIAGDLDEPRAKAFVEWTAALCDEHAQRVCDDLVGGAPAVMVGQLIDKIKKLAIALDPQWAERQYRHAVTFRRVESWQNPDGTADVAGRDLPVDRAHAGTARIDSLARSVKNAGDGRPIDAIRADLFLGMIDGQFAGMTDDEIVTCIRDNPVAEVGDDGADGPPGDASGPAQPGPGPQPKPGPHSPAGPVPEPAPDQEPIGGQEPTPDQEPIGGQEPTPDQEPIGGQEPTPDQEPIGGQEPMGTAEPAAQRAMPRSWNVPELRVELSTLLGLDAHPGELPGMGNVPASVATSLASSMTGGQWRFVVCDSDGSAICSGITNARPTVFNGVGAGSMRRGSGVVELQVGRAQLHDLRQAVAKGQHAAWAAVISDIASRFTSGVLDFDTASPEGPAVDERELRRRLARAGLRRWVEVRDRYCLHPACRVPARRTDQDHRRDYAAGGPTSEDNLDSICRHDHRLIHEGGWSTSRNGPNEIRWTSALGRVYLSRPPPVMTIY